MSASLHDLTTVIEQLFWKMGIGSSFGVLLITVAYLHNVAALEALCSRRDTSGLNCL